MLSRENSNLPSSPSPLSACRLVPTLARPFRNVLGANPLPRPRRGEYWRAPIRHSERGYILMTD
eukprot:1178544-Prorocentrum_minimum.AAC.1